MDALIIIFWLLILLGAVGIYLSLQSIPTRIHMRVSRMSKAVNQPITATYVPTSGGVPVDPSTVTNAVFTFSSPDKFAVQGVVGNILQFAGIVPSSGETVTVTAQNALGVTLTATAPIPDVVGAGSVPDGITLTVA